MSFTGKVQLHFRNFESIPEVYMYNNVFIELCISWQRLRHLVFFIYEI